MKASKSFPELPPSSTSKRKSKYSETHPKATPKLLPQTERQKDLIRAICESEQVIVTGCAGTGKTYVTTALAASMYSRREIDKIIITRPNVSAGRSIGFFPGTLEEKMAPWMIPVLEVLSQYLDKGELEIALKTKAIEMAPFETMRGRSFNDSFIILDEAQNTSFKEMYMFMTRLGRNSKCVVNGDIMQHDLKETSGLAKILEMVKKYGMPIPVIEFQPDDIVRSELCKQWILAFMREEIY